jgi:hypothetical protein
MNTRPTFSLCHTTARLPDGWIAAAQAWLKNCDQAERVEYILCVPEGTIVTGPFIPKFPGAFSFRVITVPTRNGSVAGWNAAAKASTGDILIAVADDFMPCEHWDTEILNTLKITWAKLPVVLPTQIQREWVWNVDTGGDPHLLTHPILTRARYERFGYLHHPDYLGVVADDEFTVQSFKDGVVINARHLKFQHQHPNYGPAPFQFDEVRQIEHSEESWRVGRQAFAEHFGHGKPVFSLCHTTARGPEEWEKAARAWIENAAHPQAIEYNLCSDAGQDVSAFRPHCGSFRHVFNHGRQCAVDGWNAAAAASTGRFLITVADDWFPPKYWDLEILKIIPDLEKEYAVWVATGGDSSIMTFSLLTRKYYERYGYIFYPEYIGMKADDDFTAVALRDGVVIDARNRLPVFQHFHPEYQTAEWDEIYRRQHRSEAFRVGEAVFNRRSASGFKDLRVSANAQPKPEQPRRRVAVCLPHHDFQWLTALFSVQNVMAHQGFDFNAMLAYTSGTTDITRMAITDSVLRYHADDKATPYVFWLDQDNIIAPELMQRWLQFMDNTPDCDILVGWCWIPRDGKWSTSVGRFDEDGTVSHFSFQDIIRPGQQIRHEPDLGSGFPAVLMRREVLEKLGSQAFTRIPNENAPYGTMGEDFSFFWRAKEKGLRVFLDPLGKITHLRYIPEEPTLLLNQNAPPPVEQIFKEAGGVPLKEAGYVGV